MTGANQSKAEYKRTQKGQERMSGYATYASMTAVDPTPEPHETV